MRKTIAVLGSIAAALAVTGCGGAQPTVSVTKKEGQQLKFDIVRPEPKKAFAGSDKAWSSCSMHTYIYLAARETLRNGYRYFALADPGYGWKYDNNMMGFPIVSSEAYDRYCNPAYKEPGTGLEDDKCVDHALGSSISTFYKGHIVMLKKPTYLFPTWDAAETLKKEEPKVNACIDWSAYKNASSAKDIKVEY